MTRTLQSLEPRTLLQSTLVSGVLTVNGTDGDDAILVHGETESVVVEQNGSPQSFPAAAVKRVVVNGLGDDDLRHRRLGGTKGFAFLNGGGDDNDSIDGGRGFDRVFGDHGNDRFRTLAGGNDALDGGAGDDTPESGDADDVLVSVEVTPQ